MSSASFMPWLAMELEEEQRKVTFLSNYSFSTLFLLYILIRLFCQAQQSRLLSPWAAEVLPCVLLALLFSRPLATLFQYTAQQKTAPASVASSSADHCSEVARHRAGHGPKAPWGRGWGRAAARFSQRDSGRAGENRGTCVWCCAARLKSGL